MDNDTDTLITLGSASPRRAALLDSIGVSYVVDTVELDEGALVEQHASDPRGSVVRIAVAKFGAFSAQSENPTMLLTADTLVACGSEILGKPATTRHLVSMLNAMSGEDIMIATAVCCGVRGAEPAIETVTTIVRLRTLSDAEIATYVATGVGMDKAGGLALQSEAGSFIDQVDGCWSNVLGLPLCAVTRLLSARSSGNAPDQPGGEQCSVALCGRHHG